MLARHHREQRATRAGKAGAVLASVFAAGVLLGFGLGVWIDAPVHRPSVAVAVPKAVTQSADTGQGLPVRVYRFESEIRKFVYEEPLDAAVAEPVPVETARAAPVPEPAQDPAAGQGKPISEGQRPPAPIDDRTLEEAVSETEDRAAVARPAEDAPAWIRHAVAGRVDFSAPMVAVIIDDLGIDQRRTRRVIDLPGPLTLSFISYGYNLDTLVASAREKRHEIMLHLPMEPLNPDIDPGPNALLVDLPAAERARRLEWALTRFSGYVGVNNHMGSRFTAWREGMEPVLQALRRRGMLYVDSITTQNTVGYRLARQAGVPHTTRDIFLDHDMRPAAIAAALARTEEIALKRGVAVAIGHPHDATVAELARWIPTLQARGIQLVPISAVIRAKNPSG